MTRRLLPSAVVFATTSGTAKEMISPVSLLADVVNSVNVAHPMSFEFDDIASAPSDLTVTQVIIRATKRKIEVAHELYPLDLSFKIATLMKKFDQEGTKSRPLTNYVFAPDHGLELVVLYLNPTDAWNTNLLWDIENDHTPRFATPGGGADALNIASSSLPPVARDVASRGINAALDGLSGLVPRGSGGFGH